METIEIFQNKYFISDGSNDIMDYQWIMKLDVKYRQEIANKIFYNGSFLWIFTKVGLLHFK